MIGVLPSGAGVPESVDRLFLALMALSALMLMILTTLLLKYCIQYRAGSNADRSGKIRRTSLAEGAWISATLIIFLAVAAWANIDFVRSRLAPSDAYTVYAVGKQWMWKIEHPSGRREIDELHVPFGQPVRVVLTSQDVIHSFFLPAFRVKQDALPGRYTSLWFKARTAGASPLFCAEYCGAEHSGMIGHIIAMRPDEFAAWLSDASSDADRMSTTPDVSVASGEGVFVRAGCFACHAPTNTVAAPRLDGLWGRPTKLINGREVLVDEAYVRESILAPNAKIVAGYAFPSTMPSYAGVLSDDEVNELVEFIRSTAHGWTSPPDESEATP